jgi:uncharacterized heparinase superfamily protein
LGYARPKVPQVPLTDLKASGYGRLTSGGMVLFADAAAVGPAVQPGHAHADSLSFELSCGGLRVLVNGGASTYDKNALREAERGSAAHNTLRLGKRNSTEVWGGFRVGRRAHIIARRTTQRDGLAEIAAVHDGYHRLPGSPRHGRVWRLHDHVLRIEDTITVRNQTDLTVEIYFHVHPDFQVQTETGAFLLLGPGGARVHLVPDTALQWTVQVGHWTAAPGRTRAGAVLVGTGRLCRTMEIVTHVEMIA